jgi:hypothetical protein
LRDAKEGDAMTATGDQLSWRRSNRCGESGACVEVAVTDEEVHVRQGGSSAKPATFSHHAWRTFVIAARAGAFDVD